MLKYTYDLSTIVARSSTALSEITVLIDLWRRQGLPSTVQDTGVRIAMCENTLEVCLINAFDDKVVKEGAVLKVCYSTPDRLYEGTLRQLLAMIVDGTIRTEYHISWIMLLGTHLYSGAEYPTE